MIDPGPLQKEKTVVGGLKFSQELVLTTVSGNEKTRNDFNSLLKQFSGSCIPISYLSQNGKPPDWLCSFCLDSSDWAAARTFLNGFSSFKEAKVYSPVGLLTVFPHRNSLQLLGRLISVFKIENIPFYGFCTSISATTFCTDYPLLDSVADLMMQHIELPENHAPFRPEFILKQPR